MNGEAQGPADARTGRALRGSAIALALLVLWLVVRNAAILLDAPLPDGANAALLLPTGGQDIERSGLAELPDAVLPGPVLVARLKAALGDAPLAVEPFYAAALATEPTDPARAVLQMEEARRRDPRLPLPRFFLINSYIHTGRLREAAGDTVTLLRLGTGANAQLMQVLMALENSPEGRAGVSAALASRSVLRAQFLRYAADHGGDPARLFQAMLPDAADPASDDKFGLLRQLLAQGDLAHAYLAWINFLPASALAKVASVYDGDFAGLPGARPFNWNLANGDASTAEMTKTNDFPSGTALDVDFFGTRSTTIAQELLLLQPGSYAFGYMALGTSGRIGGGSLEWRITCADGGKASLLAIGQLPTNPSRIQAAFAVPAQSCPAQWLQLVGSPGEVSSMVSASYSGVAVAQRCAGDACSP